MYVFTKRNLLLPLLSDYVRASLALLSLFLLGAGFGAFRINKLLQTALSVARELGPVITALLFAGRAGSALTAEIGLMKTSKQLSTGLIQSGSLCRLLIGCPAPWMFDGH